MIEMHNITIHCIERALQTQPHRLHHDGPGFAGPRASVLIALVDDHTQDGVDVWLTVRSAHLRTNPGEVALPGGKRDPDDRSDWDTALRESFEEISLPSEQVRFLAQLDPLLSRFGVLVIPFVAAVPASFVPTPNPTEVQVAFRVPLGFFLEPHSPDVHQILYWPDERDGVQRRSHAFLYDDHNIWGLTASFLLHLIQESHLGPLPFEVDEPGSTSWFERTRSLCDLVESSKL